jgi:hypothetical protein
MPDSTLITMPEALAQLRYTADDETNGSVDTGEIQRFINSAADYTQRYLQRYVYVDQATLDAAVLAVPDAVQAAEDEYTAAIAAAAQMPLGLPRDMATFKANTDHDAAASAARWTYLGIVMNESIKRGMLMLISHYDQNREAVYADVGSVAEIPLGVDNHLFPYRVQLGV